MGNSVWTGQFWAFPLEVDHMVTGGSGRELPKDIPRKPRKSFYLEMMTGEGKCQLNSFCS